MVRKYVSHDSQRKNGRPISFGLWDCMWSRYNLKTGKEHNYFKCGLPNYAPRWRQIVKAYEMQGVFFIPREEVYSFET